MHEHTDGSGIEKLSTVVDVGVSPDRWQVIEEHATDRLQYDPGATPETAYWDAVFEYVEVTPNIHVNGDVKGVEDIVTADVEAEWPPADVSDPTPAETSPLTETVAGGHRHIDIPATAAETLLPAYHDVVSKGYEERLDVFLENHAAFETTVTVDGEPINEWLTDCYGRGADSA